MIPEGSQDRLGSRENTHVGQKSCKSSTFFNSLRLHPCLARVPLPNFCCLPVRAQSSPRTRPWQSKERMVVVDTEIRTFTHAKGGRRPNYSMRTMDGQWDKGTPNVLPSLWVWQVHSVPTYRDSEGRAWSSIRSWVDSSRAPPSSRPGRSALLAPAHPRWPGPWAGEDILRIQSATLRNPAREAEDTTERSPL